MNNYILEENGALIQQRFEFINYGHALEILTLACKNEWNDLLDLFLNLKISKKDILKAGGNESEIPKKFDDILYPKDWKEIKISGDLHVNLYQRLNSKSKIFSDEPTKTNIIKGFIDGHNIDFIKGKVAFDLEWNSKDQTFDRDLLAMRTYFECGIIDVGVIVTRSEELTDIFKELNVNKKYGASTTHMNKLLYRLDSRRNGGCPILAVGIKKAVIED